MIKLFSVLVSMAALLVLSPFQSVQTKPVAVTAELPALVEPGGEFEVKLHVQTHGIGGFARLQHYLPIGFTAEAGETQGADFIFDENNARFIWTDFPSTENFTITYRIKVDSTLKGRQIINGIFIYINDERTEKLALNPIEIWVGQPEETNTPIIARKVTSVSPEEGVYRVSLTIQPNNQSASARFIDEIPFGYIAEKEETYQSSFAFEEQHAVFTWKKLPSDSAFTISYLVRSKGPTTPPEIQGVLVYSNENDDLKESGKVAETIKDELIANENENAAQVNDYTAQSGDKAFVTPSGLYYRVQICATRKSPARQAKFFTDKYKVEPPIDLTYHEGWRKYLVGTFSSYREARAFKTETRKKVSDAFVVAYENGVRIPLAEIKKRKKINQ